MSSPPIGMLQSRDLWGDYNNVLFAIRQAVSKIQTATLVKVVSCTNDGGVSAVGFVNVQILVNQQNSAGIGIPEGQLVNLPYLRIQGGANAVIIDPQAGDIGIAVFTSRDISTVVATKAQANPPTFRMHDFSDGLYLGGLLNGTPTQYVQFTGSGIAMVSPNQITIQAPTVNIEASTAINLQGVTNVTGTLAASGSIESTTGDIQVPSGSVTAGVDVTAGTFSGLRSLKTHTHGGVTTGSGDTGPPL